MSVYPAHIRKVTGHAEYGIRATRAPVDERHERIALNDAGTHAPCYITSVPYVFDSCYKFHLQYPLYVINSCIINTLQKNTAHGMLTEYFAANYLCCSV
jgi:hypothetical protein